VQQVWEKIPGCKIQANGIGLGGVVNIKLLWEKFYLYIFTRRLRFYTGWHRLFCDYELAVMVPSNTLQTEKDEVFMHCEECGRKYHLIVIEPDHEIKSWHEL